MDLQRVAPRVDPAIGGLGEVVAALHGAGPPGWRSAPLWSAPLVVLVAESSAWSGHRVLTPELLAGGRLLLGGAETGDRALHQAILRALGGPPAQVHYAPRDDVPGLVSSGFGFTLAAELAPSLPPGVIVRPLDSDAGWVTQCAFWPPGDEGSALRSVLEAGGE
jgi:DNA-binding transcriptional LysR family regulator